MFFWKLHKFELLIFKKFFKFAEFFVHFVRFLDHHFIKTEKKKVHMNFSE